MTAAAAVYSNIDTISALIACPADQGQTQERSHGEKDPKPAERHVPGCHTFFVPMDPFLDKAH